MVQEREMNNAMTGILFQGTVVLPSVSVSQVLCASEVAKLHQTFARNYQYVETV